LRVFSSHDVRVANLVFDIAPGHGENSAVIIDSSSRVEIADNEMMHSDSGGVGILSSTNTFILRNRVHNNGTFAYEGGGITGQSNGAVIASNVVYDNAGSGIEIYPSGDDWLVLGNTVVANTRSALSISGNSNPSGNRIVNNIFAFNAWVGVDGSATSTPTSPNAAITNLIAGNLMGDLRPFANITVTDSITADPQFVTRGPPVAAMSVCQCDRPPDVTRDLRLQPSSAAIDRADPSLAPPTDADRRPRGAGPPDLGAYESNP
jgi:parallel beta-helix repeat protein